MKKSRTNDDDDVDDMSRASHNKLYCYCFNVNIAVNKQERLKS